MKNGEHTPGPWRNEGRLIQGPGVVDLCEVGGADLYGYGIADAVVQANARLVAAAPDLLRELERCVDRLHRLGDQNQEIINGSDGYALMQDAGSAIAKAKGLD